MIQWNSVNSSNTIWLSSYYKFWEHHKNKSQGSNLTFEDNSQMASTWSRFTSHKCVSTSLGTCAAQNSPFCLTNNSNMRKCKTAVTINCNKLYNITCIVRGLV